MARAASWFTLGVIRPSTTGNCTISPRRSCGTAAANSSLPVTVTGPSRAARTGPSSAACIAASSTAGCTCVGSTSTPSGLSQPVVTSSRSAARSTSWPGFGSCVSAWPPSTRMTPSAGSTCSSPTSRSSWRFSATSSTVGTTSTSRVVNSLRSRSTGLADAMPAASTVASKSMPRPDCAGTNSARCSPARTMTASSAVPPSSAFSFSFASAGAIAPMLTPPTCVPRGTLPRCIAKSARYSASTTVRMPKKVPSAILLPRPIPRGPPDGVPARSFLCEVAFTVVTRTTVSEMRSTAYPGHGCIA